MTTLREQLNAIVERIAEIPDRYTFIFGAMAGLSTSAPLEPINNVAVEIQSLQDIGSSLKGVLGNVSAAVGYKSEKAASDLVESSFDAIVGRLPRLEDSLNKFKELPGAQPLNVTKELTEGLREISTLVDTICTEIEIQNATTGRARAGSTELALGQQVLLGHLMEPVRSRKNRSGDRFAPPGPSPLGPPEQQREKARRVSKLTR